MAYTVINATGEIIEDVNAADDDLAVGINLAVDLDATELAAASDLENVWVCLDGVTAADLDALYAILVAEDEVVGGDYTVVQVTPSTGASASASATGSEVAAAVADGKLVVLGSLTDEEKRVAAKTLTHGQMPGKRTS